MLSLHMPKVQTLLVLSSALVAFVGCTAILLGCTSGELDPGSASDAAMEASPRDDGSTRWPPNASDASTRQDTGTRVSDGQVDSAGPREDLDIPGGDVSGAWCGAIRVLGTVTVPAGQALEVCAGTSITVADGARLRVDGQLFLHGTSVKPIRISGSGWLGIVVAGAVDGTFTEVRDAGTCIKGNDGAQIVLHDSYLHSCGQALNSVNGAHMDRTIIEGGSSVSLSGGLLKMTDSIIDLMHDTQAPDCTKFTNTSVELSHVRFTGCHCPLHFGSAGATPIAIEDSVFDGATYPAMVANVRGRFARNHFSGTSSDFLDIGGSIDLDIADNYYEGNAPDITGGPVEQFKNRDQYRDQPVSGAGPR